MKIDLGEDCQFILPITLYKHNCRINTFIDLLRINKSLEKYIDLAFIAEIASIVP
jgi:hypothetical protein